MTAGWTRRPDLTSDSFCELRVYRVAAGRAREMEARVQQDLRTLFPKHGIRPHAGWSTIVSPVSPAYVYLTPWRTMEDRSTSWAHFYSDPEWAEVRARTNAGAELVESYEVMFVRAVSPWVAKADGLAFVELVIQATAIGKTAAVLAELDDHVLPTLKAAGAHVFGIFDMISGRALPAQVSIIGWESLEQRSAVNAQLQARANAIRGAGLASLFGRAEHHLMTDVPVDWA
ncbi:MAG: hypothetical protein RIS52_2432 [Pseudomonadota bacterium]